MYEKMRSGPEIVTDTLLGKNFYLFCIHFGLPAPLRDAPAALKTRPKRLKQLSDLTNVSRIWPPSLSRAPILASRAVQVLPGGVRNRLGFIFHQFLIDFGSDLARFFEDCLHRRIL